MANYQELHDQIYEGYKENWNYHGQTGHDIGLIAAEFMTDIEVYLQQINDATEIIGQELGIGLDAEDLNVINQENDAASQLVSRVKGKILEGDRSVIRPIIRFETDYVINTETNPSAEIPAHHKLRQLMTAFPELISSNK